MPRLLIALALALCLAPATAALAAEPHHDLVRVPLSDPAAAEFLRLNRNSLDIVRVKPGVEAHILAKPGDEALLRAAGLAPEVMQRDMEQAAAYPDKGVGFGIFHTYSESVAFMDSLRTRFPTVISQRFSIGNTYQGRTIWAYRLSDNPDVDEGEPEILIDGAHHAREIMAAEFPIMFAEYLCTNYGTDPEITWLVNNRELYLIPIVNPDGFVYNETTNPTGGGLWRKNRSPQAGGQIGVDLNRNYPNHWAYDDIGSSPTPADITYRGPSPASEHETQAMLNFVNTHEIITHDSVHTYSGLTLYPWGYVTSPSPHDAIFDHIAAEMTKENGYEPGQPGAVLYTVNGGIFDTFYGTTTNHPAIFSMSNEIGTYGFWPPESNRGPEFRENIWPHIYLMRIAGPFLAVHTPVVVATAKAIAPGQSGTLSFTVENQSVVASALNVSVTVTTDDPWIQLQAAERNLGNIPSLSLATLAGNPIPFTVDAACPDGHVVQLTAVAHMSDGDLPFTLNFVVGTPAVMFSDTIEAGTGNWTFSGTWGQTTTSAHSPTRSLADTPTGSYIDDQSTYAQLNGSWRASKIRFWHRYATEANYDYCHVQVSANNGPWTDLVTYNGSLAAWTQVELNLGSYAGQDLRFRFLLTTDYSVTADGWYIDDIELDGDPAAAFTMAPPVAIGPIGGEVTGAQPLLTVANSAVPGGGAGFYGFRIYGDALCTELVDSVDDVPEGTGQTSWSPWLLTAGDYWWRAWAGDGTNRTDLNAAESFTVQAYTSGADLGEALGLRVLGGAGAAGSRFELTLPARAEVTVDIHDARGARIQRLFAGSLDGGGRTLTWDGRDGQGRAAASGVYFVRALVDGQPLTGRVVIVR